MKKDRDQVIRKGLSLGLVVLFLASIIILAFTGDADAERRRRGGGGGSTPPAAEGCKWNGNDWLMCEPGGALEVFGSTLLGTTGCIGIKNTAKSCDDAGNCENVGIMFTTSIGQSGTSDWATLDAGKERKADFDKELWVSSCYKARYGQGGKIYLPAAEIKVNCKDVFQIIKNADRNGGCGCKNFDCLEK